MLRSPHQNTAHSVVRAMPNTPCTIGAAASAYVLGTHATKEDGTAIHTLLSAVGLAMPVEERMMDAGGWVFVCTIVWCFLSGSAGGC